MTPVLLTGGSDICWGRTYRRKRKGNRIDRKVMSGVWEYDKLL